MTALPNWPWRRVFNRTQDPDIDIFLDKLKPDDQDFITKNFVDHFGQKWLPENSDKTTFDNVLQPFWSEIRSNC